MWMNCNDFIAEVCYFSEGSVRKNRMGKRCMEKKDRRRDLGGIRKTVEHPYVFDHTDAHCYICLFKLVGRG